MRMGNQYAPREVPLDCYFVPGALRNITNGTGDTSGGPPWGPFFLAEIVYLTLVTTKKLPFFCCVDFIVCTLERDRMIS